MFFFVIVKNERRKEGRLQQNKKYTPRKGPERLGSLETPVSMISLSFFPVIFAETRKKGDEIKKNKKNKRYQWCFQMEVFVPTILLLCKKEKNGWNCLDRMNFLEKWLKIV